ncbi:GNAT family N-acetyltransferase [Paenibacillus psychroresistens]|uniref:GNAT family N-acetyltransferase n=1 Tax=Paenibacillus psychroresistens TaxID=1778678 RepID=A0A6B8RT55_9BACL|nr:GNAT family N-acetyltransferase [Paenibacillus psychroresistens]QGQ99650.1 GNAT family N-acetyltransferase [Paenibacillus psychroresistens]
MSSLITLYDKGNIAELVWPDTEDGQYARRYLMPLVQHSVSDYFQNVQTKLMILALDHLIIPITINDKEYTNSYVCSPFTHYVSYAKEELYLVQNRLAKLMLPIVLDGLGLLLKLSRINRVVHVNNWLVSTNLYPNLTADQINRIIDFIKLRFPQHAIVFRSLNQTLNSTILAACNKLGSKKVPSRKIYFLSPSDATYANAKSRWLVKRDYALLAKKGYQVIPAHELKESDIPRILQLYNALYLDKYSYHNPQFTEAFMQLALQEKILQLYVLRKHNQIDAVLGFFIRNGAMTTPLFGYDTSLPQELGLYRMLSAVLLSIAEQKQILLHESSGAAQFKRNRGARGDIEYSIVFDSHLPLHRRWSWSFLEKLLTKFGIPLLEKYKL